VWLVVPLSFWLVVAAFPVIALLFRRGAYTTESMVLTAECLRWFAIALIPGSLLMILQRAGSAWHRNWLVAFSSFGLALTSSVMTFVLLPAGSVALPIAVLAGNAVAVVIQAWLLHGFVGRQVLQETLRTAWTSAFRSAIALAPLVLMSGWFLTVDAPSFDLAVRLLTGLAIVAGIYVGVGFLTADKLTRELVAWGWDTVRSASQFVAPPRR
jgi:putative peptidoglycan lipid II flippase